MKKALAIFVALLIVAGAAYFVYLRFFDTQIVLERMVTIMSEQETIQVSYEGKLDQNEVEGQFVFSQGDQVSEVFLDQVLGVDAQDNYKELFDLELFVAEKVKQPPTMLNGHLAQVYQLTNEQFEVRFWIDFKTHFLYQAQVLGKVVDQSADEIALNLVFIFAKGENSEETTEASADATSLPSAAEGANNNVVDSEGSAELPTTQVEDWNLEKLDGDRDGDGLADTSEVFYGSDPDNPDSDGDGISDGDEVEQGNSPIDSRPLFNFGLPQ